MGQIGEIFRQADMVFFHPLPDRNAADAEEAGRLGLVPMGPAPLPLPDSKDVEVFFLIEKLLDVVSWGQ